MEKTLITVVGAGVAGLTSALMLSENDSYSITVLAKHHPNDVDIEYCSQWAGADFMPMSTAGGPEAAWEKETWLELERLARLHPEAGIHFQEACTYNRAKDADVGKTVTLAASTVSDPHFKRFVPNFRRVPKDRLPRGYDNGNLFTSVCIDVQIYLPWLKSKLIKAGVVFKRKSLKHVLEAKNLHHSGKSADVIVNCTGLGASKLGGVEDKEMFPARGQTVLVRNEGDGVMYVTSGTDDGDDEVCYTMQRPAGGGTLLGGSYQKGNWDPQPDPNLAIRIMKRALAICPALTDGKGIDHLDIVRHGVGLRPMRIKGARLEKERMDDVWVIHNYGHGGAGYQTSYGCSQIVVNLVANVVNAKFRL